MMTRKTNKKPISRNYAVKSDDDPKTNKTNILVYAIKSDNDSKDQQKTNIQELCCKKAMMIQKPTKTISLSML